MSLCHCKYTLTIWYILILFIFVDVMYNGEMNEKIKLLYRLHIPPGKKIYEENGNSVLL